ncbi:radical SAM family heme chaperone HemW [Desulfovibrio sp. OttesenSCG-928-C06]|nr:radical SAM family heme chaperone HemW [Desulfovibrio sp. OttesenSCG-928-C06]
MQLYIHVPFCRSRCSYCSFYSMPLPGGKGSLQKLEVYLKGLLAEMALWHDRLGSITLDTIYFGGGTPSILPIESVELIMKKLGTLFKIAPGAEITFEGNPESILEFGYAAELARFGVNRLSLGIQSLNDEMLKVLGRPHTVREAIAACETAQICGINNISLDLIWGLPGQRLRLWLDELKAAVQLKPQHLSCYNLTLDENTPMTRAVESGEITLPEEKEQANMFAYGSDYLAGQGFMQYEISNYARMGFKGRHNLGYWEGNDYIGLGPSATSTLKSRRWTNPPDLGLWSEQVNSGSIAHDYEELDRNTRVLELIMLRLRTDRGMRLQAYKQLTGRDFISDNKEFIHALHNKQMLRIRNGYLSLTGKGMLVSNSILGFLFNSTQDMLDRLPAAEKLELEE